jgi:hypothetical protein
VDLRDPDCGVEVFCRINEVSRVHRKQAWISRRSVCCASGACAAAAQTCLGACQTRQDVCVAPARALCVDARRVGVHRLACNHGVQSRRSGAAAGTAARGVGGTCMTSWLVVVRASAAAVSRARRRQRQRNIRAAASTRANCGGGGCRSVSPSVGLTRGRVLQRELVSCVVCRVLQRHWCPSHQRQEKRWRLQLCSALLVSLLWLRVPSPTPFKCFRRCGCAQHMPSLSCCCLPPPIRRVTEDACIALHADVHRCVRVNPADDEAKPRARAGGRGFRPAWLG